MARPHRTFVRRFALALAVAQLTAFALVPVIEANERASGPPTIEAAHQHCARLHQPATCLACVLLAARARTPERVVLAMTETESRMRESAPAAMAPSRAPPRVLRTRAPPLLAA